VEPTIPRANQLTIALPPFVVGFRAKPGEHLLWEQVVRALGLQPDHAASYDELLTLLGKKGDAAGARAMRRAISALLTSQIEHAPIVRRIARGRYQLGE
jgi:hypothetical protein